ncbi:hypothetical protein GCM10023206_03980 [Acinetobacter puyangensis]|uniref:Uncharacterized protein n=1 Tax=Acinetobacter puyangensis TaxID=1096779 RepID=A0A240EC92_9GAMM|nr:hypothetical protein [Acinetobacter puyangensis]SNX46156.1 hypothetical protein SAMN05421731_108105 [Acinetobacter puyangensis]
MTKIHSGLVSIATMVCASAAFAEPPLQPGDTLESLAQVKVETTINGQPGSLEQMGIPKQVIAQAIAQNAVIDIQNQTLIAASSIAHAGADDSLAQHTQPSSTDIQAQAENPVVVSDDPNVVAQYEQQQLADESQHLAAQHANSDSAIVAETDSTALAQSEPQPLADESQHLAAQNTGSDPSVAAEVDSTALAQSEQQPLADESQHLAAQHANSDSTVVVEADPNMVALQPNQQIDQDSAAAIPEQSLEQIDPNAQAVPAQSEQMDNTQQYGDTESGLPEPLQ